jgi:hypothetical protein
VTNAELAAALRAWVDAMPSRDEMTPTEYVFALGFAAEVEAAACSLDEIPQAPSRLASEGRALPYMGRRRSGQETNAAG